jgi:surface polysaccharide O-acyltransferase-like enzyme
MPITAADHPSSQLLCPPNALASERLVYGDLLRTAGALAVVLVHVAHEGTRLEDWVGKPEWWWCATFDAMGRWAVPVFLMLGGAIFLHDSRQEPAGDFYRKRLLRIGIPYVCWSVFFLGWYVFFQQPVWELPPLSWSDLAERLLAGATASHLHYLGVVLGLYAFTPMLRVYTRHASHQQVCWATGGILVITVLSDAFAAMRGENILRHALIFNRFVPYLGYYLLGFCLRDVRPTRKICFGAGLAYVVAVAVTVVGTRYMFPRFGAEHGGFYFYGQLSPTRTLVAAGVFMLAKLIAEQVRPLTRFSAFFASLTLGIYLVHPVFMDLLAWAGLYVMTPNVWVGLPLRVMAVYLVSMSVIWLVRFLPGSRYLVG